MEVQEYSFSTCKYFVHDNYIIAETIQNLDVSTKEVDDLYSIVKKKMNEGFGLIEIRPNNTSIDPSVYMYAEQLMPNLKAFALVTESERTLESFFIEKQFMNNIQGAIFNTLKEAKKWMQSNNLTATTEK